VPGDKVTIGASADHHVVDGHHSAQAMERIKNALDEPGVQRILEREDTIPDDADVGDAALGEAGVDPRQAQILISCKSPIWFGWLCWLFKK